MIRALIVDDEYHAREELAILLSETGCIDIIGKCANGIDALKLIKQTKPQVLFLDIQMPVIDGFELLSMIDDEIMPHVVFVTAYDEYSLKAFEEKTLDYLLKPVEKDRLEKTITKVNDTIRGGARPHYDTGQIHRIPCISGNKIKLIDITTVEYSYSSPGGVYAVSVEGEFFTELTLKGLEARTDLIRCHKQHLINLDSLKELTLLDNGAAEVTTKNGYKVPVSRRYLKSLKQLLLI